MGEKYNKEVGARLFSARKALKMTRAELGLKIGLHESTIKRYEDGEIKSLDIEKIKEFAEALEVSPAHLMGWEEKRTSNMVVYDQEALELLDTLRSRPEMQMLFSVSKDATVDDIMKTVKIIEALKDGK